MKNDLKEFLESKEEILDKIVEHKTTDDGWWFRCNFCNTGFIKNKKEIYYELIRRISRQEYICDDCYKKYTLKELIVMAHEVYWRRYERAKESAAKEGKRIATAEESREIIKRFYGAS